MPETFGSKHITEHVVRIRLYQRTRGGSSTDSGHNLDTRRDKPQIQDTVLAFTHYHINHVRDRARSMLRGEWGGVYALAAALLKRGELEGAEAEQIIRDNLTAETRRRLARRAA